MKCAETLGDPRRSDDIMQDQPSEWPPSAVRRQSLPLSPRSSLRVIFIIYTYRLLCVIIFFLRKLPFSVNAIIHKIFFILSNYIIILESVMIRSRVMVSRVTRCRKEGTINCRYRDIQFTYAFICIISLFMIIKILNLLQ